MSRTTASVLLHCTIVLAALLVAPNLALAQQPLGIQSELLVRRERPEDGILFCLNAKSVTAEFDRAIGKAIASALLLKPVFTELAYDYTLDYDYVIPLDEQELYIHLYNVCDAVLGYAWSTSGLPEWLTVSRPYYRTFFPVYVTDPAITALADLQPDSLVGTRLGSAGDSVLLRHLLAQSETRRSWIRQPYANHSLLFQKLHDGSLAAAFIWEPAVQMAIKDGLLDASAIHRAAAAPVAEAELQFGVVLLARESFLAVMIDQAIDSLIEAGTIQELLNNTATPGAPPVAESTR